MKKVVFWQKNHFFEKIRKSPKKIKKIEFFEKFFTTSVKNIKRSSCRTKILKLVLDMSRYGLLTRKFAFCVSSISVIYGFKRAKIQDFQLKVAIFAIFTFKNDAFKHTSDWAHGEVSNALFGLQSSHPRIFSAIACVENRKRAIFDCQKNL